MDSIPRLFSAHFWGSKAIPGLAPMQYSAGEIGNSIVDQARRFMAGILMVSFVNGAAGAAEPAPGSGHVTFLQAPEGARTVKFRLTVSDNPGGTPQGYLVQRSPQPIDVTASVPPSIANA